MITYREMREQDIPYLLDMIWKMWAGPKVKQKPRVAIHYAEMVLYYELRKASIAFVADDDGKAVGVGTHEELLSNCGVYQEIYASQFKKGEVKGQ